ncbi:MAG TPA: hypothetical protein VFL59_00660 [Candidatus Nanopelagicales bacterium]|nr:hypothetical protein [Candidatus Nanopelagicales bacterium]
MGLRTFAVVALAAALGWLVFRAAVTRRVPWISLALVLLLLVPLFVTERQWLSTENRLAGVARSEARNGLGVHCQRFGETFTYAGSELGHVEYDETGAPRTAAFLSYDTCQQLSAYLGSAADRAAPTLDEVIAVHVLTHETAHLTGIAVESEAECWAVQRDARTATMLGATPDQAAALVATYWTQVYPRMPDAYRTPDCAPRARLDETPTDSTWP